jgi:outer membrane protein assembly factor BamB
LADARPEQAAGVALPKRPELLWMFIPVPADLSRQQAHTPSFGGILAHAGLIFTTDELGLIYAINAKTGDLEWAERDEEWSRSAIPTIAGDAIYFANAQGVVALSWKDGTIRWKHPIPHGASESSPLIVKDRLFIAAYDGFAYALNLDDGSEIWKVDIVAGSDSSERARLEGKPARPRAPATDGQTMFLPIFDQSRMIAIGLETGRLKWSLQTDGWIYGRPFVTDRHVLVGSQDRRLYCVDKENGEIQWTDTVSSRIEAGSVVHGGSVYYGSCAGEVIRANIETGDRIWKFQCDFSADKRSPIYCQPIATDELVYVANMEGQVYAIDTPSGTLRWKMRPLPFSEIVDGLATDGQRLFLTTRPDGGKGDNAVVAIGYPEP